MQHEAQQTERTTHVHPQTPDTAERDQAAPADDPLQGQIPHQESSKLLNGLLQHFLNYLSVPKATQDHSQNSH